jgi:SAM-dependent methyltransferase
VNGSQSELDRLAKVYGRRADDGRYSVGDPAHRHALTETELTVKGMLVDTLGNDFARLRFLDVGCGQGYWLHRMIEWGVPPSGLAGLDALPTRVAAAKDSLPPGIELVHGDATRLPWPDASFDVVSQFVVFSSILDQQIRMSVAREMVRVLKPGGAVVWYDFHVENPSNPDVRKVGRSEITTLFGGGRVQLRRVTLAPPLARMCCRISPWTLKPLGHLPFLKTHYAGLIIPSV